MPTVTASEAQTSTSSSEASGAWFGAPPLPPPVIHSAEASGYLTPTSGTTTSRLCVQMWPMADVKSAGVSQACEVRFSRWPVQPLEALSPPRIVMPVS